MGKQNLHPNILCMYAREKNEYAASSKTKPFSIENEAI